MDPDAGWHGGDRDDFVVTTLEDIRLLPNLESVSIVALVDRNLDLEPLPRAPAVKKLLLACTNPTRVGRSGSADACSSGRPKRLRACRIQLPSGRLEFSGAAAPSRRPTLAVSRHSGWRSKKGDDLAQRLDPLRAPFGIEVRTHLATAEESSAVVTVTDDDWVVVQTVRNITIRWPAHPFQEGDRVVLGNINEHNSPRNVRGTEEKAHHDATFDDRGSLLPPHRTNGPTGQS